MSPIRHAVKLLALCMQPRRRLLLATAFAVLCFNLLEVATPKILQLYVDSIAGNPLAAWGFRLDHLLSRHGHLILLPMALLVFAAARWLATYIRSVYQTRLGQGALFDLRSRIFNTMQNLSFAYHDASHSGTLISNVTEDVNYANMFLQRGIMLLLESVVYTAISFVFMITVCPAAGVTSLLLYCIGVFLVIALSKHGYPVFCETRVRYADTVQMFSETMEGYLTVKGFGAEKRRQRFFNRSVDDLHKASLKEHLYSTLLNQALQWTTVLGIPAVMGVALFEARAGRWELTAGRLFLLFYLQYGIRMRAWGVGRAIDLTMRFVVTAERIGTLLLEDSYLVDRGTRPLPLHGDGIRVENLGFSYGDRGHSIKNISMHIHEGETIGLVGPTGAGKSSLALLLCRFYDPDKGRVLIHGSDIRDYPLQALRNQFSLVFQDTFLFSASIRDNIAYGHPTCAYEDIVHAATTACIHDFIMSLPNRYDTVIGERGVTLSGGQRQRISIARAILRKPAFLILDACTSALDSATEKAIQDSLATLGSNTTVIIIAHRFSSIEQADRVFVIENGEISESGTPNELKQNGHRFRSILRL